ncbi:unnamed protein product [Moneuplotes crassus]|uniref:Uncharacterized protein n=1 Tax=Euplotes crassus TaxID=5936 RepID=A0AAD2D8F4_EUPCR|nr:unnamed protein product [Moneuplotes crassus]
MCQWHFNCVTKKAEFESKAKKIEVYLNLGAKYFNFDDYDNPIKGALDNRIFYKLVPNLKKLVRLYVRKSTVSLSDSIFPFGQEEEKSFYSIGSSRLGWENHGSSTDATLVEFELSQDLVVDSFERRVYTFLDLSGQLGGVFEIMLLVGGFLVNYFPSRLYNYSIFNHLYSTEARKYKKTIKIKVLPRSKYIKDENVKGFTSKGNNEYHSEQLELSEGFNDNNQSNINLIDKIKFAIERRRRNFSTKDLVKACLPFVNNRASRQFSLLNDRFSDECDLPSILCPIRQLKTLMRMILKTTNCCCWASTPAAMSTSGLSPRCCVQLSIRAKLKNHRKSSTEECKHWLANWRQWRNMSWNEMVKISLNIITSLILCIKNGFSSRSSSIEISQTNNMNSLIKARNMPHVGLFEEAKEKET